MHNADVNLLTRGELNSNLPRASCFDDLGDDLPYSSLLDALLWKVGEQGLEQCACQCVTARRWCRCRCRGFGLQGCVLLWGWGGCVIASVTICRLQGRAEFGGVGVGSPFGGADATLRTFLAKLIEC